MLPSLQTRLLRHREACDWLCASHLLTGTEESKVKSVWSQAPLTTPFCLHKNQGSDTRRTLLLGAMEEQKSGVEIETAVKFLTCFSEPS